MTTITAIQNTGSAKTFAAVQAMADFLMLQDDCYGARVYHRDGQYHVQSLHASGDCKIGDWLPDDMRVVIVPTNFLLKFMPAHNRTV